MHSNTLLIIRKRLKINIIKISKDFILIIIENIKCKNFRIKLIKKKLSLNIYYHIY